MIQFLTPLVALVTLLPQDGSNRTPVIIDTAVVAAPTAAALELRIYDVGDHTGHARLRELIDSFSETYDPMGAEAAMRRFEELEQRRKQVGITTKSLVENLQEMIEPPLLVDGVAVGRVGHLEHGSVVLFGNAQQHAWLESFLESASELDGMVDIQAKLFVVERGKVEGLTPDRSGSIVDELELREHLAKLLETGAKPVVSPRLLTLPFQEAELMVVNQQAYVRDYELKVLPELDQEIADPIIDVVHDGLVMKVRAIPLQSGRLRLSTHLEYSVLNRPIPSKEVFIGSLGHKVTLQLPEVTRVLMEGKFDLGPGQSLLLLSADPTGEQDVVVFLQAKRIVPENAPVRGR